MANDQTQDSHALQIRPSIGIAVQHAAVRDAVQLMQIADDAMYRAKRSAELNFCVLEY